MAFDPRELEKVEERLFALRGAARKHQTTPAALADVLARYQAELEMLQSGEEQLDALEAAAAAARDRLCRGGRKAQRGSSQSGRCSCARRSRRSCRT